MKKLLKTLVIALTISFAFSTTGFAKSEQGKQSLVALGDSIAYGYNLENNNNHVSRQAYPYLIGEEANLRVRDLAVPGWRTDQLLEAVQNDEKFREAIRHSDYITLSIGSNDLLQLLKDSGNDITKIATGLPVIAFNLNKNTLGIINEIRELSDSPIVIYNIYNPFQQYHPIYAQAPILLSNVNPIYSGIDNLEDVEIADAYTAFAAKEDLYVIDYVIDKNGKVSPDVHPTVAGQKKLAEIGFEAFGF